MNKELKYLLKKIKNITQDYVGINGCLYQDLSRKELDLLLNYVTNLQQENHKLKKQLKINLKINNERNEKNVKSNSISWSISSRP